MRKKEKDYQASGADDPQLSRDQLIELMVRNPRLIERPIVVCNGRAAIGRPPEKRLGASVSTDLHPRSVLQPLWRHRGDGTTNGARRRRGRPRGASAHRTAGIGDPEATAPPVPDAGAPYSTQDDLPSMRRPGTRQPDPFRQHGRAAQIFSRRHQRAVDERRAGRQTRRRIHLDRQHARRTGDDPAVDDAAAVAPRHADHGAPVHASPNWRQTQEGGTPYGPSHVAGLDSKRPLSAPKNRLCQALGRRLAQTATALRNDA